MKIYTKTGDTGETALFGGQRVSKTDDRVVAYGTVDELNAFVGSAAGSKELRTSTRTRLNEIMSDLFDLGAELATPPTKAGSLDKKLDSRIDDDRLADLEGWIDEAEEDLAPLTTFVLPGGSDAAARLHICRVVTRRAERAVVALDDKAIRPQVLAYLNRLSDLFFVWARLANHDVSVEDTPWQAKKMSEVQS